MARNIRKEQPRIGLKKSHYLLKEGLVKVLVGINRLFAITKGNQMLIKPNNKFSKHKNLINKMETHHPKQV